ncbi:MAG: cadherin-like beta sandwich domain-containing protein [Lachnospiraceae bacterium]|nr:cadherin-like beta sandwich domain-containing protein [Lachnospiraceae bacterium]
MRITGKHLLQKLGLVLTLAFMLTMLAGTTKVWAASADITFSLEGEEAVSVGDTVVVLLQITADATIGDFEGYLVYDSNLLEYTSGPSCVSGSDGYLRVYDMDAKPSDYLRSYVLQFTAINPGVCQFGTSRTPMVYAYENGSSMSVKAEPFSFRIAAAQSASSNAKLETLRISPGRLTPEFSSETTEYEVTLESGTDCLVVSAVPQDLIAKVQVSGNEKLVTGINEVKILVTAENGEEQIYRIFATVEKETEAGQPSDEPKQEKERQLYLESVDGEGTFLCADYRYKLAEDVSAVEIPEGYEQTELFINGSAVTVYQKAGQEEFCLIVLEGAANEAALYRFDRTEYTVQRYQAETIVVTSDGGNSQKLNELLVKTKEYEENLNRMSLIAGALGGAVLLLLIIAIRVAIRSRYGDEDD